MVLEMMMNSNCIPLILMHDCIQGRLLTFAEVGRELSFATCSEAFSEGAHLCEHKYGIQEIPYQSPSFLCLCEEGGGGGLSLNY